MSMTTIFWCGVGLMVLSQSSRAAQAQRSQEAKYRDPTNWGADQWARIYGDDLAAVGGQHGAQSGMTVYGMTDCMGFGARVAL